MASLINMAGKPPVLSTEAPGPAAPSTEINKPSIPRSVGRGPRPQSSAGGGQQSLGMARLQHLRTSAEAIDNLQNRESRLAERNRFLALILKEVEEVRTKVFATFGSSDRCGHTVYAELLRIQDALEKRIAEDRPPAVSSAEENKDAPTTQTEPQGQ